MTGHLFEARSRALFLAVCCFASWLLVAILVYRGLALVPHEIVGGTYSNTDGHWAEWNALGILRFGTPLDLSPFNAFAGSGNMFLPNLPWLNPGAVVLALVADRASAQVASYCVYAVLLCGSIIVLARALGLSWLVGSAAAQLHLIALFPPFSLLFLPMEWYSAAPVYAQIAAVWNAAFALFLHAGRSSARWAAPAATVALPLLILIGCFSAPFSFLFFAAPYVSAGALLMFSADTKSRERRWQLLWGLITIGAVIGVGFVDYWLVTINISARTPTAPVLWASLASWEAWAQLLWGELCRDPRALVCAANPVAWFQVLGLAGGAAMAVLGRGRIRTLGVWALAYVTAVHLYVLLYRAQWLGPIGTVSAQFLSWSSYSLLAILAIGGPVVGARALMEGPRRGWFAFIAKTGFVCAVGIALVWVARRHLMPTPGLTALAESALAISIPVVAAVAVLAAAFRHDAGGAGRSNLGRLGAALSYGGRAAAICLALLCLPLTALRLSSDLLPTVSPTQASGIGPIVERLRNDVRLTIGSQFQGYVATFWSDELNATESSGEAARIPWFRYVHARGYFAARYGTSFTEVDLWRHDIPTFEEYGQWVSRQSQLFVFAGLADDKARQASKALVFLRLYKLDIPLMEALGVRYLVTNEALHAEAVSLEARESRTGSIGVSLYQLRSPNLGNYSPVEIVITANARETLARIAEGTIDFARQVLVEEAVGGPFIQARAARMTLTKDGYRVTAESSGRSILVLPIQYSNCLSVTDHTSAASRPALARANFLQTALVFERQADVNIELDFGLPWRTRCRRRDIDYLEGLSL